MKAIAWFFTWLFIGFFTWLFIANIIMYLAGCNISEPAPKSSPCALSKTAVDTFILKDGYYKSPSLTQPLGTVGYMEAEVNQGRAKIRTVTLRGVEGSPSPGIDSLIDYKFENGYFILGDFRCILRKQDSISLFLTWQSRDFDLKWYKKLPIPVSIKNPSRPKACHD